MTSLKKLLAVVTVSLPIAASAQAAKPAPAPAPLVQLYGTLNVNLQYTEASGATAAGANVKPRFALSIDSTNVGVRGTAALGSTGLKAVYQCETQASVDGEDTRAICNRNSRLGLSGAWGTLFYGNWDTPYKAGTYGTKADDPFGNTDVFGFQGIMGSPGFGVRSSAFNGSAAGATTASFDQRAANSVAYWSPSFSGLSLKVQYSVDEFRSAAGQVDPQLISGAVNFDMAGLSVVAEAEYHEDAFGVRTLGNAATDNSAAKDLGLRLAAGYELPLGPGKLDVMGMVERLQYKQDKAAAGVKKYSRVAWLAGAKFRTGSHEFRARYSQALDPDITLVAGTANEDDLGAKQYALGYSYYLASTTQVYAFYTQIMNDDRAKYTFGVSGAANVVGANTPVGSEPYAFGLGMRHAF